MTSARPTLTQAPGGFLEITLSTAFTQRKATQVRNYWMAINRSVVKDILAFVINYTLKDGFNRFFVPVPTSSSAVPEYKPVANYDILFNQAFLEAYCQDPPRPQFPNVNGRIKLRRLLKMFNSYGAESEAYRILWLNTPCVVSDGHPLCMPTKEEQIEREYLYRFDIYWGIVMDLLPSRTEVDMTVIREEIRKRTTEKRIAFKASSHPFAPSSMEREPIQEFS
jgi:hypothetical protein